MTKTPHWIAASWSTNHLCLWAMGEDYSVLDKRQSDTTQDFEPTLNSLAADWLTNDTPIIACGPITANAPYTNTPCLALNTPSTNLNLHTIPGLSQSNPPNIMHGPETQIAGFLAANPNWDGVICLPGNQTIWAQISANEIVSFQTFITGEMLTLLSPQATAQNWDETTFATALDDAMSRPHLLAANLASLRADHILNNTTAATQNARLTGLLIGTELAAARPYWLGQNVAIIGSNPHYATALTQQGVPTIHADPGAMTLAGLCTAHATPKAPS